MFIPLFVTDIVFSSITPYSAFMHFKLFSKSHGNVIGTRLISYQIPEYLINKRFLLH